MPDRRLSVTLNRFAIKFQLFFSINFPYFISIFVVCVCSFCDFRIECLQSVQTFHMGIAKGFTTIDWLEFNHFEWLSFDANAKLTLTSKKLYRIDEPEHQLFTKTEKNRMAKKIVAKVVTLR